MVISLEYFVLESKHRFYHALSKEETGIEPIKTFSGSLRSEVLIEWLCDSFAAGTILKPWIQLLLEQ